MVQSRLNENDGRPVGKKKKSENMAMSVRGVYGSTMIKTKPIFIGGTGRCGTSILIAMLQESPMILQLSEPEGFHRLFLEWCDRRWVPFCIFKRRYARHLSDRLVYSVTVYHDLFKRQIEEMLSVEAVLESMNVFRDCRSIRCFKQRFDLFSDRLIGDFTRACGRPLWCLKQPGYIFMYINRIYQLHPTMRFIHIVRDGRDVIASMLSQPWAAGDTRQEKFEFALNAWSQPLAEGLRRQGAVPKANIMTIRFEDLVAESDAVISRIFDFLNEESGLPDNHFSADRILRGNNFDLRKAHIGTYRELLEPDEIALIQSKHAELLRRFGYT